MLRPIWGDGWMRLDPGSGQEIARTSRDQTSQKARCLYKRKVYVEDDWETNGGWGRDSTGQATQKN